LLASCAPGKAHPPTEAKGRAFGASLLERNGWLMGGTGFEELSLTFDVFLLLSFSDDVKNSSAEHCQPVFSPICDKALL
jgi:hypothetical protein